MRLLILALVKVIFSPELQGLKFNVKFNVKFNFFDRVRSNERSEFDPKMTRKLFVSVEIIFFTNCGQNNINLVVEKEKQTIDISLCHVDFRSMTPGSH